MREHNTRNSKTGNENEMVTKHQYAVRTVCGTDSGPSMECQILDILYAFSFVDHLYLYMKTTKVVGQQQTAHNATMQKAQPSERVERTK